MQLFTVASDTRLADLAVLLESSQRVTSSPLQVIPFDDNIALTQKLCSFYGADLCKPDPFWDQLGHHVFGGAAHRERGNDVKAWRYFRKFNAISTSEDSPFLFLDANSVLLSNPTDLLKEEPHHEIIFGHFSMAGRNFSNFGKYLIDTLAPGRMRNYGYGAGFWMVPEGTLRPSMFRALIDHHQLPSLIGPAPEQAILNLVIVFENIPTKLIRQRRGNFEYLMIGADSDRREHLMEHQGHWSVQRLGTSHNPGQLVAAKWTGNYHRSAFPFPQRDFHYTFARAALHKISGNADLHMTLSKTYSSIYGHHELGSPAYDERAIK